MSKDIYSDDMLPSVMLPEGSADAGDSPEFKAAAREVTLVLSDSSKKVLQVWVCGSASPDGLWEDNVRLAQERTDSAVKYLKDVLGIPSVYIYSENLCEDWKRLARLVEESDMPYRSQVLDIIAHTPWGQRKDALRELNGGAAWDILVRDFFPQLSCVRFAVFCRKEPGMSYQIPTDDIKPVTRQEVYEKYREESLQQSRRKIEWLSPNVMAVKTNLIPDAMLIPSFGVEFQIYKGLSFELSGAYGFYNLFNKAGRSMSCSCISPELRLWLGGHPLQKGSFFGIHGNVGAYTLEWTDKVAYHTPFSRPAWSAGLTYGYSACLDRNAHWGLEFVVGVGYGRYTQDIGSLDADGKFVYVEGGKPMSKEHFGLTRLALNLVYRFSLGGQER